jgi:hypothetical protein
MKALLLIAILFIATFSCQCQTVPNGSFETWTNVAGVETPVGWDVSQILNCTPFSSSKTTDKDDSTYAILLETATCTGAGGVHEGFAISNFAINSKPLFLNGAYKSERVNTDSSQIKIVMYFIGVNIGSGLLNVYGNTSSYTNFSIPITYGVTAIPESIQISCFSDRIGHAVLGNKLWVDKLSLSSAPLTTRNFLDNKNSISIFPNPGSDKINIVANNKLSNIIITNTIGNIVQSIFTNSNSIEIDISNFSVGVYFVKVNGQVLKMVKK